MGDRYVDDGGTPSSPYESWADAAANLETAVEIAAVTENVWVDKTTTESAATNLTISPVTGTHIDPTIVTSVTNTGSAPTTGDYAKSVVDNFILTSSGDLVHNTTDRAAVYVGLKFNLIDKFYPSGSLCGYFDCDIKYGFGPDLNTDCSAVFDSCVMDMPIHGTYCRENAHLVFRNITMAANSTTGRAFISYGGGSRAHSSIRIEGLDASAITDSTWEVFGAATFPGGTGGQGATYYFSNILLPTSGTMSNATIPDYGFVLDATNVGVGSEIQAIDYRTYAGTVADNVLFYLDGDRGDGTNFSLEMDGTANAVPGVCAPWSVRYLISEFYSTADPTVTVHAFGDHATAMTDDKFWIEVEHPKVTNRVATSVARTLSQFVVGSSSAIATESDPGWTVNGSPSNPNYYAPAVTVSSGGEGVHRVYACFAGTASDKVYVDPAVDLS